MLARELLLVGRSLEAGLVVAVAGDGGWAEAPPTSSLCRVLQAIEREGPAALSRPEVREAAAAACAASDDEWVALAFRLAPVALGEQRFELPQWLEPPEAGPGTASVASLLELLAELKAELLAGPGRASSRQGGAPREAEPAGPPLPSPREIRQLLQSEHARPYLRIHLAVTMCGELARDLRAIDKALEDRRWPTSEVVDFWLGAGTDEGSPRPCGAGQCERGRRTMS
ncbi:MAG: hypothetical protein FJ125_12960 [Deltaproteobacteria bacterium]|nr:hypothetical protein [Deltaproteobacteria bacterium]